jgi:hypothetical protein
LRAVEVLLFILLIAPLIGVAIAFAGGARRIYRWNQRRKARTEAAEKVEKRLAIKEEIERRLPARGKYLNRGDAIIRDVHRVDRYPEVDDKRRGISPWFKVELKDVYHRGLEVFLSVDYIRVDNENRTWETVRSRDDANLKGYVVGRIPFDWIVRIDWEGDEFYGGPHIYCRFISKHGGPYEELVVYYKEADSASDYLWLLQGYSPASKRLARLRSVLPGR